MLARDVLDAKGRRLVAIDSEALVNEAIAKLVQNNIGSLPVVDADGLLVGVFSERDVLRLIHHRGDGFGRLPVSEVMTRNPATCDAADDVEEVMGLMSRQSVARVPVNEDGKLVGVISVGDVIKVMHEQLRDEHQHLMTYIQGGV